DLRPLQRGRRPGSGVDQPVGDQQEIHRPGVQVMGIKPSAEIPGEDPGAIFGNDQIGAVYTNIRLVAVNMAALLSIADNLDDILNIGEIAIDALAQFETYSASFIVYKDDAEAAAAAAAISATAAGTSAAAAAASATAAGTARDAAIAAKVAAEAAAALFPDLPLSIDDVDGLEAALIAAGGSIMVADRTALAALTPSAGEWRFLEEAGRFGWFKFSTMDLATKVAIDTVQGLYVAPASDADGSSGAWVRQYDGPVNIKWFGAVGDGVTSDATAFTVALAVLNAVSVVPYVGW